MPAGPPMTQAAPCKTRDIRCIVSSTSGATRGKRARQPGRTSQGAVSAATPKKAAGRCGLGRNEASKCPARGAGGARALRVSSSKGEDTVAQSPNLDPQTKTLPSEGIALPAGDEVGPADVVEARRRRDQILRDYPWATGCELSLRFDGRRRGTAATARCPAA